MLGKEPGSGKIKSSKSEGGNFQEESKEQTVEGSTKRARIYESFPWLSLVIGTSFIFVQHIIQVR